MDCISYYILDHSRSQKSYTSIFFLYNFSCLHAAMILATTINACIDINLNNALSRKRFI